MNKNEFLRILRESLEMSLEKDAINEQLDYYDRYISDEVEKGRSEKEVIDELGDPRLIAKTIKTVSNSNDVTSSTENSYGDQQNRESSNGYRGTYNNSQSNNNRKYATYDTSGIGCVIAGLVAFIIISLILRMFGYMVYGLGNLAFSGPIGFMIVLGLLYLIFGRGGRRF
ncbi:MAG: DUF1700 domain-containing protein [Lachnospiraceae bacterium]|nr:DUF1700 domain-containing protein [Lachnospiraceae bacterium]